MPHLLFILIALCTVTNIAYCAENNTKSPQMIIFEKGHDTKIPKTFFMLDYKHGHQEQHVIGTGKNDVEETFENIFLEEISVVKKGTDKEYIAIFRPTIIKVAQNNTLENNGTLLFNSHQETHNAIRSKKAIFYHYKQGAIIYFIGNLNVEIIKNKQKEINEMIESNIPETISLQLFRTFSGF